MQHTISTTDWFESANKNIMTYEESKNCKGHIWNQGIPEQSTASILIWYQKRATAADKLL